MKKLISVMLTLCLFFSLANIASADDVITTKTKGYRELSEPGTVIQGEGYSMELVLMGEAGKRVFGRMYYPQDFDPSGSYITMVLNHGGGNNADFWDKFLAPEFAKAGYVCIAYDCRSAQEGGRGSYGDPTESGKATMASYAEDMCTALDYVETLDYVDKAHIYVMGSSMGGGAVQAGAAKRSDEIAGMIVLYGSLAEDNKSMLENYEAVRENPYHNGEVLFIQGSKDTTLPAQRTLENMGWYEESSFVFIDGAPHGFGREPNRPALITVEVVLNFIQRTSK